MWAIRSTRAFDGTTFLQQGATVLIKGDRIVGVEAATFQPPHDVPITDLKGTLLPGLIDGHVHLVATAALPGTRGSLEWAGTASAEEVQDVVGVNLRLQAAAGVTTVRDLGDTDFLTLDARDRAIAGASRLVAAGPPVTVPGGHCHFLGGAVDPGDTVALGRAVAERAERGVDVIKVMASGGFLTVGSDQLGSQFATDSLRHVVHAAHAAGLRVVAHTHSVTAAEVALAVGVDGLEHFTNLAEGRHGATDDLLDRVAQSGTTIGPTLGVDTTRWPPGPPPPHMVELMARVGITDRDQHLADLAAQAGRLREHGIRVVSGLDAGAMPAKVHGELWRAVAELVRGGWPVDEALATATSVAADECGVPAGRLGPGALADLLVVDGDVATDVEALSHPIAVWIGGSLLAEPSVHPVRDL